MKIKPLAPLMALTLVAILTSTEVLAQGASVLPSRGALGAKIQTGDVKMVDLPGLIMYWIQSLLQLAGGFAVVMIMVGGVQYMIGSVSNSKEHGKNTLIYALGGLVLAFFAWWIVELVQVWMTS